MAGPVVHRAFTVERTYPAPPARVFAAFADPATKRRWFVEGPGVEVEEFALDFRVGGFERRRSRFVGGAPARNDTLFLDIVPDERGWGGLLDWLGDAIRRVSADPKG